MNAVLVIVGFVFALFAVAAIIAGLLHLYLAFEGFVASRFEEDALGYRADGDWPHIPDGADVFLHVREIR